jgi:hypothetical protein
MCLGAWRGSFTGFWARDRQEDLEEDVMPTYKVTFREATGETREETVVAESHGEALAKAGPARAEESVEIREDEWGNTASIEESTSGRVDARDV